MTRQRTTLLVALALTACMSAEGPVCGDGVLEDPEECDDGNLETFDGCGVTCEIESYACPNGIVEPGEECDDGNYDSHDGCTEFCARPMCGDGIVHDGEACDDGNTVPRDGCSLDCTIEP